ncbi:MAG TPA: hypothetical protein VIY48_06930 [Candidatus Paceibacterota bacterium]
MTNYSLKVIGYKAVNGVMELEDVTPPPETTFIQYYMQKEDRDVFGSVRGCAPCPAVFVMKDDPHAKIGQQWQYAIRAANFAMTLKNVYLLLDDGLAFANRTGFKSFDVPNHADYFFNRYLSYSVPKLDKVRTTSRSVMTGVEQYSVMQALTEALLLAKSIMTRKERSFMRARQTFSAIASAPVNVLRVKVFDSRQPPPLNPGYSYPNDISEVDPMAYAMMPWTNPEMWMVANIVKANGIVYQFPRGAAYPYWQGGAEPVSFMPHIADLGYGEVLYGLNNLVKLPLGSTPPRNYTI